MGAGGEFICEGCSEVCVKNPRLGDRTQRFCHRGDCQRKRHAEWQRVRIATDPEYRAAQREADALWRRKMDPRYWATAKRRQRSARAVGTGVVSGLSPPVVTVQPGRYVLTTMDGSASFTVNLIESGIPLGQVGPKRNGVHRSPNVQDGRVRSVQDGRVPSG